MPAPPNPFQTPEDENNPGLDALRRAQERRNQARPEELQARAETQTDFQTYLSGQASPFCYALFGLGMDRADSRLDYGPHIPAVLALLNPAGPLNRPDLYQSRSREQKLPNDQQRLTEMHEWIGRLAQLQHFHFAIAWSFSNPVVLHSYCYGITWDHFVTSVINEIANGMRAGRA